MKIRIVFFSGTGGTRHASLCFKKEFLARKHEVEILEIRHDTPPPEGKYDLLLLCFAVHAGGAPTPVLNWIRNQAPGGGRRAALISVSCGGEITPNLACRLRTKYLLKKRGFDVFHERMLIMPSNWVVPTPQVLIDPILNILPGKIAFTAHEILQGKQRLIPAGMGNRIIEFLGRLEHAGARSFGRGIRVKENCTGCRLCSKSCPVGNISMKNRRPSFGKSCIMCMACLYRCPAEALYPTSIKSACLPGGYDLENMLKQSEPGISFPPDKESGRMIWKGVRRYLGNTRDMKEPVSADQGMPHEETAPH